MNSHNLPKPLKQIIASRKVDFITQSKKKKSLKASLPAFIFMLIFMGVLGFITTKITAPILEKELSDSQNLSNIENWKTLMVPAISLGIMGVIGLGLLINTIKQLFDKGSFFVGTEEALIIYKNRNTKHIKWNEFSGKITMKQKHNYGDLILELKNQKAGKIIVDEDIYEDNVDEELYNETIHLIGIRNIMNIESKCKYRISQYQDFNSLE